MNEVKIMGHLGADPEIRYTKSGKAVASLSIATTKKRGETETTTWHKIIAWEWLAKQAAHYQKGDLVYVTGELTTRTWEKTDGTKAYITEIVAGLMVKCQWFREDKSESPSQPEKEKEEFPF
jgi:single-strand DNA-binding protein